MKFVKKGKVKNVYVFTEEELSYMWVLMNDGLKEKKAESEILASLYSPYERGVYSLLVKNGYFDRLDERFKKCVGERYVKME